MDEGGLPVVDRGDATEGVEHELGDHLLAGGDGGVAEGATLALLAHDVLLGEAVQHRHDGRVGDLAVLGELLVDLAHGQRLTGRPQAVHDVAFEFSQGHGWMLRQTHC